MESLLENSGEWKSNIKEEEIKMKYVRKYIFSSFVRQRILLSVF